jgi:hypothetical protein
VTSGVHCGSPLGWIELNGADGADQGPEQARDTGQTVWRESRLHLLVGVGVCRVAGRLDGIDTVSRYVACMRSYCCAFDWFADRLKW